MTDIRTDLHIDRDLMTPRAMAGYLPVGDTPIVPKRSIAGRALVAVDRREPDAYDAVRTRDARE